MKRKVEFTTQGFRTQDGAGVNLVRVLGNQTVKEYDPILMLDSFDSVNPDDYTKGFPMHPHRGIETVTYLRQGSITHRDSLGNEDTINNNEVQWMTTGSGIMHEEMPQASERMLGVQLWLNLPQKDKMVNPEYYSLRENDMQVIDEGNALVKLISGNYKDYSGFQAKFQALDFYELEMKKGSEFELATRDNSQVILFTLVGDIEVEGQVVSEKTAVSLSDGDGVVIRVVEDAIVLFLQSDRLNEELVWGGPIVMNTKEELSKAFSELREGTFIKSRPEEHQ